MKTLDYSRELLKKLNDISARGGKVLHQELITLALPRSVKFMIPDYRILGLDEEFRSLDDEVKLSLPYPCMSIEFSRPFKNTKGEDVQGKCVVIAMQDGETINTVATAMIGAELYIDPVNAINREGAFGLLDKGKREVRYSGVFGPEQCMEIDIIAVMGLLNVLSCSNVSTRTEAPSTLKKQIAKDRGALPYDTYHVLSVDTGRTQSRIGGDGTHASPREHLRRGHIRRLQDGRKIWVNAAIVGSASRGRVHKDYALVAPVFH